MTLPVQNQPVRNNDVRGRERLLSMPRVFVYRTATFGIATGGSAVPIQWDTVDTVDPDTDGMFNIATPTVVTCRTAGTYEVDGWVLWPSSSTSYRQLWIMKNSTLLFSSVVQPLTGVTTSQELSRKVRLSAGDTIGLAAAQVTGGTLTLPASPAASAYDHGLQACLIST